MARLFSTIAAITTVVLAGCGGGSQVADTPASPTSAPSATAIATATPTPPTAIAPSAPSPPPDAPTPSPTAGGESGPGGAGDEAGARIPVEVTVGSDGTVSPSRVSVPAFFALELRVRNRTAGSISVSWTASEPSGSFEVGAGKVGTQRVAGVKKGEYPLAVAGAGTATIVSGVQPGP